MGNLSLTCNLLVLVYTLTPYFLLIHQSEGKSNIITKHLYFPNFNPNPITDHIKLLGSSKISPEEGSIQIPNNSSDSIDHHDYNNKAGRAIFSSPIRLFDPLTLTSASFNTTFSFHFSSTPNYNGSGGDGFAFVIVADEFTVGRAGPWMGILNDGCAHYKVFAVEFDTTLDQEVGDSSNDHIGIDVGTIVSFKVTNLSSQNGVSLQNQLIHRAWISYNSDKKWIDVYFGDDKSPIPSIPILSSSLNLDHLFNEYMFVGFSASSENSTQIHHILSWNFSSSVQSFSHIPNSKHVCQKKLARQVSKYSGSPDSDSTSSSFFIFLCVLGLVCVSLINLYFSSTKRRRQNALPLKKERPMLPNKPHQFKFMEIYKATRGFSKEQELGKGSNWILYKATLPNRSSFISLKRFISSTRPKILNNYCYKQFQKRISILSSIEHPRLASIRGWCFEIKREMMIAYDYFPNGSVDKWLDDTAGFGVLPWNLRLQVIKETAETLCFLHSIDIPHRNITSSSVFLDENNRAILGDYGFLSLTEASHDAGKKQDVFKFGILVLEFVVGKKLGDEEELISLGWEMHKRGDKGKMILDHEGIGSCENLKEAIRVLKIGLSCTLVKINEKPSMEEVLHFNFPYKIPNLPPSRPLASFVT